METDLSTLMGKTLTSVIENEGRIILNFDDGTVAEISAEAGMGYNEGLAWVKCEVVTPNAAGQTREHKTL
jgi:hypothetical protein